VQRQAQRSEERVDRVSEVLGLDPSPPSAAEFALASASKSKATRAGLQIIIEYCTDFQIKCFAVALESVL